jgi:hypothetical protein
VQTDVDGRPGVKILDWGCWAALISLFGQLISIAPQSGIASSFYSVSSTLMKGIKQNLSINERMRVVDETIDKPGLSV